MRHGARDKRTKTSGRSLCPRIRVRTNSQVDLQPVWDFLLTDHLSAFMCPRLALSPDGLHLPSRRGRQHSGVCEPGHGHFLWPRFLLAIGDWCSPNTQPGTCTMAWVSRNEIASYTLGFLMSPPRSSGCCEPSSPARSPLNTKTPGPTPQGVAQLCRGPETGDRCCIPLTPWGPKQAASSHPTASFHCGRELEGTVTPEAGCQGEGRTWAGGKGLLTPFGRPGSSGHAGS